MSGRRRELRALRVVTLLIGIVFTSALSILYSPLPVAAQQLGQSELPKALSSRPLTPRFEHLDLEDGLSQSAVYYTFQDSKGFIWFCTQDGLNRYDGYEFKVYRPHPFDSTGISDGWVWTTMEDRNGDLWVSTNQGGLNRMNRATETFTHYRHDPDDQHSLADDHVWSSLEDRDGTIWVTTGNGLSRMDPERRGVFTNYHHDEDDPTSLSHDGIFWAFQDSDGDLWFSTENGLSRMNPANPGVFTRYLSVGPEQWEPRRYEAYQPIERPEEPGVLWIGTGSGLVRLDKETGDIERFLPHPPDPSDPLVNAMYFMTRDPANPGVLWATTGGGLARFDIRARSFVVYRPDPSNPNSLSANSLESVYADRSGTVWVGTTRHGVNRFSPTSAGVAHIRSVEGDPNTLPTPSVRGIYETRDDVVWVGSDGDQGTLTALDRSTGKAVHYRPDPANPSAKLPGSPGAIVEDRRGLLWVGVTRGIDRLDRATGRFRHFRSDTTDPGAVSGTVTAAMEDRLGNLWFGALGWLNRYDYTANRFVKYDVTDANENPRTVPVRGLVEDVAGFFWMAAPPGVRRFNPENGQVKSWKYDGGNPNSLSSPLPLAVLERAREPGIIWVGTLGGGLNRLDSSTGKVRFYTDRDGLPNNVVYGILEDDNGLLWLSTNHGLSRFDPESETFRNYGLEIGLQSLEFNSSAAFESPSGEMFFGGVNGVNVFYPNQLAENTTPPEVAIVDLKLFNESVTQSDAVQLDEPVYDTDAITLDYSQKDLAFDFVAFHYANPSGNSFAYKLEGFNDDWVYTGNQRTATFTNLSPGEYTFRVKAANSDGVWNEEGASMRIVVTPPFWQAWWFRLLAIVMFGGVLYAGYSLRVRQIAARNRQLESEVGKRTAELQESKEQLETTNEQLEQSHTIVEAINQETSFRRLLTKILEEARVIPGVEKATALVRMPDDLFHVRASSGWDVEQMQHIRLTPKQAHQRYVEQSEEVVRDIFIASDIEDREGKEEMAEFGNVASFMVLRIIVDGDVNAYLVFDNLTDPNAFQSRDAALLDRLREHIQSAFIKTRILENLQNTLNDLRSTQDRLIHSEKMASLGQLTAGIAHEIKNPLNFVNNFSELSKELTDELLKEIESRKDELPPDFVDEISAISEGLRVNAEKIHEHGKRADGIVYSMLQHSHGGEAQREGIALNAFIEEYLNLAYHGSRARYPDFNATLERDYDEHVEVIEAIPQDLGRVLLNLMGNAFDALRENGEWSGESGDGPKLAVSTKALDGRVEIRIADNGPGIPEKVKAKIFEPFFTTKPTGSGTGLGLSMSYDIITKGHGGTLDVESTEGQGATFIVRLPA